MAYMNQEKKKQVATTLKPILASYGLKGSLSVRNHITLVLTIKSGKVDFLQNYNDTVGARPGCPVKNYVNVNPYWYHEHFSGKAKEALEKIFKAMKSAGWYDNSDAQIDYFDTAYYVDVTVGTWEKPYQITV